MKRFVFFSCLILMLAFVMGSSTPCMAQEKVIKLKYSNFFPPSHKNSILSEQWGKEIEKRTDGRVKITYFAGNTLTPPTQTYDSVVKGIADIGQSLVGYAPGRFPLTEVLALPLGYSSGTQATNLTNEFYKKFKPKEFDDTQVMYFHGHGPGLFNTKKVISSLDDVKGMRIKANAENAAIVSAVGGAPVSLPITETYDGLQKGLIDGVLLPIEPIKGWKFYEKIKTIVENYAMSYTAPIFVVMNKDKWNSLPKDIQDIIVQVNAEWVEKQGKQWTELDKESKEFCIGKGIKMAVATPEQQAETAEKMKPILAEYVANMKAKGLPGEEALKFCQEFIKNNK
ncbi:MAG: TRAP transporter substrate-binding protein [Desulfomonilaceae bacterium]